MSATAKISSCVVACEENHFSICSRLHGIRMMVKWWRVVHSRFLYTFKNWYLGYLWKLSKATLGHLHRYFMWIEFFIQIKVEGVINWDFFTSSFLSRIYETRQGYEKLLLVFCCEWAYLWAHLNGDGFADIVLIFIFPSARSDQEGGRNSIWNLLRFLAERGLLTLLWP